MTIKERIQKIHDECEGVWSQYDVTSWERIRLEEWADKNSLSPKQLAVLESVEVKVFGKAEEDDHYEDFPSGPNY